MGETLSAAIKNQAAEAVNACKEGTHKACNHLNWEVIDGIIDKMLDKKTDTNKPSNDTETALADAIKNLNPTIKAQVIQGLKNRGLKIETVIDKDNKIQVASIGNDTDTALDANDFDEKQYKAMKLLKESNLSIENLDPNSLLEFIEKNFSSISNPSQDKLSRIISYMGISDILTIAKLCKKISKGTDKQAIVNKFIQDHKDILPEHPPGTLPESTENAQKIYHYFSSEIKFNKDKKVNTEATTNSLTTKSNTILDNLLSKAKTAINTRNQAKKEAEKAKAAKKTNKSKIPQVNLNPQKAGKLLDSKAFAPLLNLNPEVAIKTMDGPAKLAAAFDMDLEAISIQVMNADTPQKAEAIIKQAKAKMAKQIEQYVDTNLAGKTKEDLIPKALTDDQKEAYMNTIPGAYRGTEWSDLYAEYLTKELKEGAHNPPKSFDEFLTENTSITGLQRLFMTLMSLFKDFKGQLDFSPEGKKARKEARRQKVAALRKKFDLPSVEEVKAKEALEKNIDELLSNDSLWERVQIQELEPKKKGDKKPSKKQLMTFLSGDTDGDKLAKLKDILTADETTDKKTVLARKLPLKWDTLEGILDAKGSLTVKDEKLVYKGADRKETQITDQNSAEKVLEAIKKKAEEANKTPQDKVKELMGKYKDIIKKNFNFSKLRGKINPKQLKKILEILKWEEKNSFWNKTIELQGEELVIDLDNERSQCFKYSSLKSDTSFETLLNEAYNEVKSKKKK